MNERAFLAEVRGFLFYSRFVWPLHRLLARRHLARRCGRCVISANYRPIGAGGLCQDCEQGARSPSPSRAADPELIRRLRELIGSHPGRGKGQFDALLLFSGGKDSSYMVKRIRDEHPGLRLLLFSVDNTL
jgi:hypothetical protein